MLDEGTPRYGWRWAFLFQIPLFVLSYLLTGHNLHYVTPVSQAFLTNDHLIVK